MRRLSGPLHPLRHPSPFRRGWRPSRRSTAWRPRAATQSRSAKTPKLSRCRQSSPTTGIRFSPLHATRSTVLCCHVGSSSQNPADASRRSGERQDDTLLASSPSSRSWTLSGRRFWERFPELKFSHHRRRRGMDPVLPVAGRARPRPARRLDEARFSAATRVRPTSSTSTFSAASSTIRSACRLLDKLNLDNLCWESDFPHSDGTWPQAPEALAGLLAGVPADLVAKITHENAMRHYHFDPFTHRPKEQCTAAALRAESPEVDVVTRVGRLASEKDLETWKQYTGRKRSASV